ncbi:MAG: lipoprotein-releasing system permease protein [Acidobacteriota bacterium]|jgi:lipoprotein-releasing system permease protein|nr:lipoprotein-releasing system permease protein [Acidobacteriota bacterium]
MPLESRIARRYLWAARKQAHTAFLSGISMLGLAVGVATLLISIALLSGLQGQIKQRLIQSSPQVLVEPSGQNMIDGAPAVIATAQSLGVRDIRPFVRGIAYGANEDQSAGRPMRVRSYVPGREPVSDRSNARPVPQGDEPRIFVTRGFAASVSLDAGDLVTVIAPRMRLTPFGPVPVMRRYRIARIVMPGGEEDPSDAWLTHEEASNLFGTGGRPTAIEMYGDPARAEAVQAALAARFPKLQFKTWKEINRPLFLALRLEKVVMFATISLIIFVAALNLVSSLSMLILEKRPSVGVLRTLGATEKNIRSLFMQLGLLIGLTGTVLGNLFGIGLAWAANRWHLIPLPPDIYFTSYLPFALDVEDVVGVNIVAVILSIVATWYPARIASRLDPIAAIKED